VGNGEKFGKIFPLKMKFILTLFLLFHSLVVQASPLSYFKNRNIDFIPVPVFETRPDKGNSYGLLPVLLFSDKEDGAIKTILGAIGQYNSVTKTSGALIAYLYPEPEQKIEFYAELGQHYTREITAHFTDPHFYGNTSLDFNLSFLKTPFGHFFGLGPATEESGHSNYVSQNFFIDFIGGYYLFKDLRTLLISRFHTTDLQSRAMDQYDDLLSTYGGLQAVSDSTNFINGTGFAFDTRKDGPYSTKGSFAQLTGFGSSKNLGSDRNFGCLNFEALQIFPFIKNRTHGVARLNFQRVFGKAPVYELSALGGPNE
jgi:hypothetical protein